jgi:hypothetical protein
MKRLIFVFALAGCTDADMAHLSAMGSSGHIKCWSGGAVIFEGDSTGVIHTVDKSDGWEFKDIKTGKFTRISGACVIQN